MDSTREHSSGRWARRAALAVVVALVGAGGWLAGRVTMRQPVTDAQVAPEAVTAVVADASVGRTLTYMVTVTQPFASVATNSLAGVVTQVGPGGLVASGDLLFAVAGRPVFAVAGELPFFRDLERGSRGDDVAQLQAALAEWGHATPVSGVFGAETAQAVRSWQAATGQPRTGTVTLGTVLAVPDLPAVVRIGDALVRGDQVGGGETAVLTRVGPPQFTLELQPEQAALVPDGAAVTVRTDGGYWPAVVGPATVDEFGRVSFALTAPDGGLVCGDECDRLDGSDRVTLMSAVSVVPATSGPAVPAAAVRTGPDGSTFVLRYDGVTVPVTVLASGDGLAIVDGVAAGVEVVVLDGTQPGTARPEPEPVTAGGTDEHDD